MSKPPLPDGLLLVLAYLFILSITSFLGGTLQLTTMLPAARAIGQGVLTMAVTGLAPLLLGVLIVFSMILLWRLSPAGRALTIMIATLMALIAALAIPVLVIEEWGDDDLYIPLMLAVVVLLSSSLTLWYLLQQDVRHLFFVKAKIHEE